MFHVEHGSQAGRVADCGQAGGDAMQGPVASGHQASSPALRAPMPVALPPRPHITPLPMGGLGGERILSRISRPGRSMPAPAALPCAGLPRFASLAHGSALLRLPPRDRPPVRLAAFSASAGLLRPANRTRSRRTAPKEPASQVAARPTCGRSSILQRPSNQRAQRPFRLRTQNRRAPDDTVQLNPRAAKRPFRR